ncbi:MAG: hypothetical protein EON58_10495 [Alphaproteobacteria bacterium]|nr:MAG: hypothetical protein EON58_10495 [Alphaproteobacteria bacterium]
MVTRVQTVAFQGIEAVPVDVQVQIAPGVPKFLLVGLPDKAVKESSERVHAALYASGLSLPPKRITVNLAPADLPKEGSHYDLPIALGLTRDVQAAKAAGFDSAAVSWGYSTRSALAAVRPTYLVDSLQELAVAIADQPILRLVQ